MTIKLPSNVVTFAAGNPDSLSLFESFKDYWNQYRSENSTKKFSFSTVDANGKAISFSEKEEILNAALKREIGRRAGVDFSSMPLEQLVTNPMVGWASFAIVSQMIDAVLPDTIIDSIGAYTDVRVGGYGDSFRFEIKPRDLFVVSKAGRLGMREAEMHKQFNGEVTVVPEMREITVGVSLYRVLSGQESLATFTAKAIRSLETEMAKDAYTVFAAAMAALTLTSSSGLRVAGYAQADLVKLAQIVSSFSGGAAPMVLGTKYALSQIFPDDVNYRYEIDSEYVKLGYLRTISGINTLELPQISNWNAPFTTLLADDRIYIVAPGTDKIVKLCIEGSTMSNVAGTFSTATLMQNCTMYKSFKSSVCTSSIAGIVTL
jgi:hypothetical protein